MNSKISDYEKLEAKLIASFQKGADDFRKGHPCPIIESPERQGWLAAQKARQTVDQDLKDYLQEMLPIDLDLYLRRQLAIPSSPKRRRILAQECKSEERKLVNAIESLIVKGASLDSPCVKKYDERLKKVRVLTQKITEAGEVKFLVSRTDIVYSARA